MISTEATTARPSSSPAVGIGASARIEASRLAPKSTRALTSLTDVHGGIRGGFAAGAELGSSRQRASSCPRGDASPSAVSLIRPTPLAMPSATLPGSSPPALPKGSTRLHNTLARSHMPSHKKGSLCPSVAPTPRLTSDLQSFQMCPAQILGPSMSIGNNAMRIRCGGAPLRTASIDHTHRQRPVKKSGSAPSLVEVSSCNSEELIGLPTVGLAGTGGDAEEGGNTSLSSRTPRTLRGSVRRVSKVIVKYPGPTFCTPPPPPSRPPPRGAAPDATEGLHPKRSTSCKKVSFADGAKDGDVSDEEKDMSEALKRSMVLLASMYDLRRIAKGPGGQPKGASDAVAGGKEEGDQTTTTEASNEEAEDLLHLTLRDNGDTEASLRGLEQTLAAACITDDAGSRHPTNLMSARTLMVVQRKIFLLHSVEARIVSFETAHAQRDIFVPQLVDGTLAESPPDLSGIRKFISQHTHSPGSPVDANKSDFKSFAGSFRLDSKHKALQKITQLADEIGAWWADETLRQATEGSSPEAIQRLMAAAVGAGCDKDHVSLIRANSLLIERIADSVLQKAQAAKALDDKMAQNASLCSVGPASEKADGIEREIQEAITQGVPSAHAKFTEARQIAKELREADGLRKRMANRQKRG
eukprot:gnl/TRDRNA2_/TRDRNA2_36121_c0_seq1.p1 gnl/TRDRNA2_/TRDRNA2_36121_c0~~gnl/TRDRNA2_/TRDRNA2_36121_c0_seq1.p1  ORF type:complete len:641 (+),score=99.59 gnl/TRDRNA2_/TRDRNA2_36121_c0_seq1:131-2053(+)